MRDQWSALSDPTRRKILALLREQPMNAGDIAAQFTLSQPAISKHLDILKNAQLVTTERHGQYLTYTLNATAMQDMAALLMDFCKTGNDLSVEATPQNKTGNDLSPQKGQE